MVRILYPDGTTLEIGGIVALADVDDNRREGRVMAVRKVEIDNVTVLTEIAWREGPNFTSLLTPDQVHALVPAPTGPRVDPTGNTLPGGSRKARIRWRYRNGPMDAWHYGEPVDEFIANLHAKDRNFARPDIIHEVVPLVR